MGQEEVRTFLESRRSSGDDRYFSSWEIAHELKTDLWTVRRSIIGLSGRNILQIIKRKYPRFPNAIFSYDAVRIKKKDIRKRILDCKKDRLVSNSGIIDGDSGKLVFKVPTVVDIAPAVSVNDVKMEVYNGNR